MYIGSGMSCHKY